MKPITILMIFIGCLAGSVWASAGSPSPTPQAKTANSSASLLLKILTKFAEQGDAKAQLNLGVMYANGEGVPKDYVQAAKWFYLGKANGVEADKAIRQIESMMSHQQIEQAQALATQWWQNHH